jgi:anti-anti-sigma factor
MGVAGRNGAHMTGSLSVRESAEEGVEVAFLSGQLTDANTDEIRRLCIAYRRHEKLVLDLYDVDFMSARALKALVEGSKLLEQAGCELVLRSAAPNVRRAFESTGTESLFTFQ